MNDKEQVLYDSPEAAQFKTGISGWVSRDGRFYADDEHMARWAGSTHRRCDECGTLNETGRGCDVCRNRKLLADFAALPVEKWDGETPLCLFDSDKYFFGEDILDWLADHPEDVRVCKCKPGYLSRIDTDTWADDLPEEGDLPGQVEEAVAALNKAISEAGPSCWWQDAIAIDVADLRSRVRTGPRESCI